MRLSIVSSAIVAVLVGFGSTLALIVSAAQAMGASEAETASWVAGLCLAMAATTGFLSLYHRLPIVTAWSTPGAALLAAYPEKIGMSAAVGAFIFAAALILLTATLKPLSRLIERIPMPVAAAMLAGVLVQFVLAVFDQLQLEPLLVLPLIILFLAARLISPAAAVLIVLIFGVGLTALLGYVGPLPDHIELSRFVIVTPLFEPTVLIGIGLPLYLVTMASQNLPGFAVLRASGYEPPARSILGVTGLASLATAAIGAHTSNLAAITAAICTGPDTHPDPSKRWMTGPFYALGYLLLAGFGASLVALFAALPVALVATVAGLALIGALVGALATAMAAERDRFAAIATFAVTASGLTLFGIGSAFWGLATGLLVLALEAANRRWGPRR